jgi:hypothetical protein
VLTGKILSIPSSTVEFLTAGCNGQGPIPSISHCTELQFFSISRNNYTGNIPDFSSNTKLGNCFLHTNKFTGFDGGVIPITDGHNFSAHTNQLTQQAIDDILQGLVDGGTTGSYIDLQNNTEPSAAGKANVDILRNDRSCSVTVDNY